MFPDDLSKRAHDVVRLLRQHAVMIATAESCTAGLIAAALTEVPGASDVVERGFITYSNAAKIEMLGVPDELLTRFGAVSAEVAAAMAEGALVHAPRTALSVAVTGIAGPGGGSDEKPVGLVYIALAMRQGTPRVTRFAFGDLGRSNVRLATVRASLVMIGDALG